MPKCKTVKLNIGGSLYETTEDTLKESGYFCNILNEGWAEGSENENVLFVDRDGFLFRYILLYLRTNEVDIESKHLESLKNEADFYLLPNLAQLIKRNMRQEPKVYKLLDHEEFTNLSSIDARNIMPHISLRGVVHKVTKFIASIQCLEKIFICPRGIRSHNNLRFQCGRRCRNARGDDYVEYKYIDKTMYLVSIETTQ